jgi:hypothetical protein
MFFYLGGPSASVRLADESRFEEPDEVGFVCRDLKTEGRLLALAFLCHELMYKVAIYHPST